MTGSALTRWTLHVTCDSFYMGEGLGEGGQKIGPDERLADDGKHLDTQGPTMDVTVQLLLGVKVYKGREC